MDPTNLRTLKLLEEIAKEQVPSQRELAGMLNVSLGLVNSFVKRLAEKGYFKITTIPKRRAKYVLTPKGAAEKTRLTYEFIQHSYRLYRDARQRLQRLFNTLEGQGVHRVVLYGVSDVAEIAFISLNETSMQIVGVVDDERQGESFLGMTVADLTCLNRVEYDAVLITGDASTDDAAKRLRGKQIPESKIVMVS